LANTSRAAMLAAGAIDDQAEAEAEKVVAEELRGLHPTHMTT